MEVVGLSLAILPLIIAVLENYEYTFQPFLIYKRRYREEVQRFQQQLKVENAIFRHECEMLLRKVNFKEASQMLDNPRHASWEDRELEARLKSQLNDCYEACVSSLSLINNVLQEIKSSTESLNMLLTEPQERTTKEWTKRLKQRLKISFSRDRFDDQLQELRTHVERLGVLRGHVDSIKKENTEPRDISIAPLTRFRLVHRASSRLYEAFSSLWPCETPEEHIASICLDIGRTDASHKSYCVCFDLTWTCPARSGPPNRPRPHRFSVEALIEKVPVDFDSSQSSDPQSALQVALNVSIGHEHPGLAWGDLVQSNLHSNPNATVPTDLPDLLTVPNICKILRPEPRDQEPRRCVGYLQKTQTFKHLVYAPLAPSLDLSNSQTLGDALDVNKVSPGRISLSERINLAQSLAQAVLQFHSTGWLNDSWQGQDVVFFGTENWTEDRVHIPYLKAKILQQTGIGDGPGTTVTGSDSTRHVKSPIRNQTLYKLGVLLIELAYDCHLKDLNIPQGDDDEQYAAVKRLAGQVRHDLGKKYGNAVRLCVEGTFGTTSQFYQPDVQSLFFENVVQTLRTCAEAVAI